jgi:hypothetical protein
LFIGEYKTPEELRRVVSLADLLEDGALSEQWLTYGAIAGMDAVAGTAVELAVVMIMGAAGGRHAGCRPMSSCSDRY